MVRNDCPGGTPFEVLRFESWSLDNFSGAIRPRWESPVVWWRRRLLSSDGCEWITKMLQFSPHLLWVLSIACAHVYVCQYKQYSPHWGRFYLERCYHQIGCSFKTSPIVLQVKAASQPPNPFVSRLMSLGDYLFFYKIAFIIIISTNQNLQFFCCLIN